MLALDVPGQDDSLARGFVRYQACHWMGWVVLLIRSRRSPSGLISATSP